MDDRKRRLGADESGSGTLPRPPLKKRFTGGGGGTSFSTPTSPVKAEPVQLTVDTTIVNPERESKASLIRSMKEAKEKAHICEDRIENLENKSRKLGYSFFTIDVLWKLTHEDLKLMDLVAQSLMRDDALDTSKLLSISESAAEKDGLANDLQQRQHDTISLAQKVMSAVQSSLISDDQFRQTVASESDAGRRKQIIDGKAHNEAAELNGLANRLIKFVRDLEERVDTLSNQRDNFKSLLAKSLEQIEAAESEADSTASELHASEKRLDRSRSMHVQSLSAGGLGGPLDSATEGKKEDVSHSSAATTPTNTNEPAIIRPDTVEVSDKTIDQAIMEQITENQMLVSFRQKELDTLNAERQQLRQEFDQLSARVANIPHDSLVDTAYYKNLQSSYEFYQDKCDALEQRMTHLSRECDIYRSDIRALEDQVRQSNMASTAAMESEIRRLDGDLARIKKTRDHSQALLDQMQSREESATALFNDQLKLVETRKANIAEVEADIKKLKESKFTTIKELFEIMGVSDHEAQAIQQAQKNVKQAEQQLQDVKDKLAASEYAQSTAIDTKTLEDAEYKARHEADALKHQLDTWAKEYAGDNGRPNAKALVEKLNQQNLELQKLKLTIEVLEPSEATILAQIDADGLAHDKLQEQNNHEVFKFIVHNDTIAKLRAEIAKYAQTFSRLKSQKEAEANRMYGFKKTNEQQSEHIKQLHDREQNVLSQAVTQELTSKKNEIERIRLQIESGNNNAKELKNKLSDQEMQANELQKILYQKDKQLERTTREKEQFEQEHDRMKRKIESMSQSDNPAEEELRQECEELRALLKCSACHLRFRSHLLLRCMHTFCKECIDIRIGTRQRRCPSCGESFGVSDVRQFYF
ncbi:hypothetical protein INT43_004138 [Umbelopsis isabellina]|uniref:E3 ubiquitin protein ligase n=1 Tax=Mortierella isabellina TaxID=91625 RepID=A0A8H7PHT8_MORIS|nr:hypothetical protein INT43_004138 [Umbelopsis isabellina]